MAYYGNKKKGGYHGKVVKVVYVRAGKSRKRHSRSKRW